MTTRKFTLGETGDLQASPGQPDRHQRDLAAHLEAELYLARLFGDGQAAADGSTLRGTPRPSRGYPLSSAALFASRFNSSVDQASNF